MPEPPIKKRKRTAPKEERADATDGLDAMEVLRRHFESQFAPLPEVGGARASKKKKKEEELGKKEARRRRKASIDSVREDDADEDEGGSEWEGLSDGKDDSKPAAPEVIHFTSGDPLLKTPKLPKSILKPFMTTKPPSSSLHTAAAAAPPADTDGDEGSATTEAQLRQNDLALQRLLRESHLLDANLEATGKNRLKAIEARVQALGGADLTKHKMPMAARVWMEKSRRAREEKRRREAREAGVVLEREVRVKKARGGRERERERGGGGGGGFGPSVGRFRNGTLVLSKRDVMDIEGRGGGGGGSGRGGGRGGKSGGKGGRGGKGKKRR